MRDEILKLRAEGKTYNEIVAITGASKSTVSYYCGEGQREKTARRRQRKVESDIFVKKTENFKYNKKGLNNKFTRFKGRGLAQYDYTYNDIKKIAEENPVCYLSGRPLNYEDPQSFHFDHRIPVSQGGDNSLENLGIASQEANMAKNDMSLEYFLDLCEDVLRQHGRLK